MRRADSKLPRKQFNTLLSVRELEMLDEVAQEAGLDRSVMVRQLIRYQYDFLMLKRNSPEAVKPIGTFFQSWVTNALGLR